MTEDKQTKIDQWLSEGDQILSDLESRRSVLADELKKVDDQILRVRAKLGQKASAGGAKATKVMIRPLIKQLLVEREGEPITVDELASKVVAMQPKAGLSSIKTSIERAIRKDAWCKVQGDGRVVFASANV